VGGRKENTLFYLEKQCLIIFQTGKLEFILHASHKRGIPGKKRDFLAEWGPLVGEEEGVP